MSQLQHMLGSKMSPCLGQGNSTFPRWHVSSGRHWELPPAHTSQHLHSPGTASGTCPEKGEGSSHQPCLLVPKANSDIKRKTVPVKKKRSSQLRHWIGQLAAEGLQKNPRAFWVRGKNCRSFRAEKGSCSLPVAEVMGAFDQDAHAVHSHDSHHQQAQGTQLQGREGEGCTLMARGRAALCLLLPDKTPWAG